MNLFTSIRPLLRCAVALEQIAACLVYFASNDARAQGRLFSPNTRIRGGGKDESELFHTNDIETTVKRDEEFQKFLQNGYEGVEKDEDGQG